MPKKDPWARRAYHRDYMRRRYASDPEYRKKQLARVATGRAVKTGAIEKKPCQTCGSPDKVEGHHEDCDRPLAITWLCRSCHERKHGGPGCHGID